MSAYIRRPNDVPWWAHREDDHYKTSWTWHLDRDTAMRVIIRRDPRASERRTERVRIPRVAAFFAPRRPVRTIEYRCIRERFDSWNKLASALSERNESTGMIYFPVERWWVPLPETAPRVRTPRQMRADLAEVQELADQHSKLVDTFMVEITALGNLRKLPDLNSGPMQVTAADGTVLRSV